MMESWHRVGEKVVCINNGWITTSTGHRSIATDLQVGEIYTVAAVNVVESTGSFGFFLEEVPSKPLTSYGYLNRGWAPSRFRPVRETSIEQFRALLTPTPETRRALEDA